MHILTQDNGISPSAFIPFCEFGGNMSTMGVKIDQFDVPVCNSFQVKILNDQLCYEVDLKRFAAKDNIENEIKLGLNFMMDYNEDRQVSFSFHHNHIKGQRRGQVGMARTVTESADNHAVIYLDTIGMWKIQLSIY